MIIIVHPWAFWLFCAALLLTIGAVIVLAVALRRTLNIILRILDVMKEMVGVEE